MNLISVIWVLIIIITLYIVSIEHKSNIITTIIKRHFRNSRQKKVDGYVLRYKETLTRKPETAIAVVIPLLITLIFALIVYKFVFFAVPISNSMQPTFGRGDLILYQTYNATPEVGDIVMFKVVDQDKPITHRVYSINQGGLIQTKGDNGGIDPWNLRPQNVHAKAVTIKDKPIVIKYVGSYITGELQSGNENFFFKALSAFFQKGRDTGLMIFSMCILLYLLASAYDISSHKNSKRR